MMTCGWRTHLATNGAGTIHDWEYAWLGRSTESAEKGAAPGPFATGNKPSRYIHLALQAGNARSEGYGTALGRFIWEDGTDQGRVEHRWKHASILAQAFRHDVD